jgi:hypothetical protein
MKKDPALFQMRGRSGGRFRRQWHQMQECLPRGETKGKAQSEREKRGLRHSDASVASSSQLSGACHATGWANSDGSAPACKIVGGMGTNPAILAGLVVLCLPLRLSPACKIK